MEGAQIQSGSCKGFCGCGQRVGLTSIVGEREVALTKPCYRNVLQIS